MKNIKQFKHIIDDYVKEKETTIKIVMLKDLSRDLGYILNQYKDPLFEKEASGKDKGDMSLEDFFGKDEEEE